jgi:hypothetical protein
MRRLLARILCAAALTAAFITLPSPFDVAPADGSGDPVASSLSTPSPVPGCGNEPAFQDGNGPFANEPTCTDITRTPEGVAEARAYLVETASPGYTMMLQGPEVAIGRLHPEFAVRLEHAIREARSAGLTTAAIFSA